MIVKLTSQDICNASVIGTKRQAAAMHKHLPNEGKPDAWFNEHIAGALAEFAVAKTVNLFWDPHIGKTDQADVGGFIEVRSRVVPGSGTDLVIKPRDKDHWPCVHTLVYLDGSVDLVGWVYPGDVKSRAQWNDAREIWFLSPPYEPIETLIEMCRTKVIFATDYAAE